MFSFFHKANVYGLVHGHGFLGFFPHTVKIHAFKMHFVSRDFIDHYRKINFL